jgi:hypothetical protein
MSRVWRIPASRKEQLGYHLQSAEDWWIILWNSGARRLIGQLDDDRRA